VVKNKEKLSRGRRGRGNKHTKHIIAFKIFNFKIAINIR
jgi:hypothetical protein